MPTQLTINDITSINIFMKEFNEFASTVLNKGPLIAVTGMSKITTYGRYMGFYDIAEYNNTPVEKRQGKKWRVLPKNLWDELVNDVTLFCESINCEADVTAGIGCSDMFYKIKIISEINSPHRPQCNGFNINYRDK